MVHKGSTDQSTSPAPSRRREQHCGRSCCSHEGESKTFQLRGGVLRWLVEHDPGFSPTVWQEQIALFEPLVANVQQTVEERTGTPFHDNECAEHGRGSCVDRMFGVFAADGEHQLLQVHCDEAIRVRPSFLDDAEFITGR